MPKSTLAEANEKKDWSIYQDFGYVLIQKAKKMYEGEKLRIDLLIQEPISLLQHLFRRNHFK